MPKTEVVVDDWKFFIKQVSVFFRTHIRFTVIGEGNNEEKAVALYRMHLPDLISLDITIPDKNDTTAHREILKDFPNARVIRRRNMERFTAYGY